MAGTSGAREGGACEEGDLSQTWGWAEQAPPQPRSLPRSWAGGKGLGCQAGGKEPGCLLSTAWASAEKLLDPPAHPTREVGVRWGEGRPGLPHLLKGPRSCPPERLAGLALELSRKSHLLLTPLLSHQGCNYSPPTPPSPPTPCPLSRDYVHPVRSDDRCISRASGPWAPTAWKYGTFSSRWSHNFHIPLIPNPTHYSPFCQHELT